MVVTARQAIAVVCSGEGRTDHPVKGTHPVPSLRVGVIAIRARCRTLTGFSAFTLSNG
jgi:hypothetical protein